MLLSDINRLETSGAQGSGRFFSGNAQKGLKKVCRRSESVLVAVHGEVCEKESRGSLLELGFRLQMETQKCLQVRNLENSSVHFVLVTQRFLQLPTHKYLLSLELTYGV